MNLKSIRGTHVTIGGVAIMLAGLFTVYGWSDEIGLDLPTPAWKSEVTQVAENLDALSDTVQKAIAGINKDADRRELRRLRAEENEVKLRIRQAQDAGGRPDSADLLRLDQIRQEIEDLKE